MIEALVIVGIFLLGYTVGWFIGEMLMKFINKYIPGPFNLVVVLGIVISLIFVSAMIISKQSSE